jgi:hypothetical protein
MLWDVEYCVNFAIESVNINPTMTTKMEVSHILAKREVINFVFLVVDVFLHIEDRNVLLFLPVIRSIQILISRLQLTRVPKLEYGLKFTKR